MILNTEDVNERLNSVDNLLNRLNIKPLNQKVKEIKSEKPIEVVNTAEIVKTSSLSSKAPKLNELIEDAEDQIELVTAKNKAVRVLNLALDELEVKIHDDVKPERLAKIAFDMSRIVAGDKKDNDNDSKPRIVIWQPMLVNNSEFNTLNVND